MNNERASISRTITGGAESWGGKREQQHQDLNPMFLVPKSDGRFRKILNCQKINSIFQTDSFQNVRNGRITPKIGKWGLRHDSRYKECVSLHQSFSSFKAISEFQVSEQEFLLQGPPIRLEEKLKIQHMHHGSEHDIRMKKTDQFETEEMDIDDIQPRDDKSQGSSFAEWRNKLLMFPIPRYFALDEHNEQFQKQSSHKRRMDSASQVQQAYSWKLINYPSLCQEESIEVFNRDDIRYCNNYRCERIWLGLHIIEIKFGDIRCGRMEQRLAPYIQLLTRACNCPTNSKNLERKVSLMGNTFNFAENRQFHDRILQPQNGNCFQINTSGQTNTQISERYGYYSNDSSYTKGAESDSRLAQQRILGERFQNQTRNTLTNSPINEHISYARCLHQQNIEKARQILLNINEQKSCCKKLSKNFMDERRCPTPLTKWNDTKSNMESQEKQCNKNSDSILMVPILILKDAMQKFLSNSTGTFRISSGEREEHGTRTKTATKSNRNRFDKYLNGERIFRELTGGAGLNENTIKELIVSMNKETQGNRRAAQLKTRGGPELKE
ncbi:MAG: hypothetical protein EZS28_020556 [Streblomastix strix]|uniref:Uncharacterized protein n=1 Tax=Streblomastix strix TaxID=222440 RepID=A0A5J4VMP9_9EUKA|nr:MAG: hypothetical protein EZS28_020556 [Streblomastix strix]